MFESLSESYACKKPSTEHTGRNTSPICRQLLLSTLGCQDSLLTNAIQVLTGLINSHHVQVSAQRRGHFFLVFASTIKAHRIDEEKLLPKMHGNKMLAYPRHTEVLLRMSGHRSHSCDPRPRDKEPLILGFLRLTPPSIW